jgi:sugar phosphate isomerase/epimerase
MKIAVSSWSMHRDFFQGKINMVEFIKKAKEDFGVDAIETVHWLIPHVPEIQEQVAKAFASFGSEDPEERGKAWGILGKAMHQLSTKKPDNLEEVKAALDKYGVKVVNMPIDYGNISQLDDEKRKADLEVIKLWIDVAAELGSKAARVNTGQQPEGVFDLSITAASYRELAEYAETKNVVLILENHGGMSADPDNILKLFEMVDHPNFRICPDFGNFEDDIRYEALDKIFGLNALLVHAKTYDFDEQGNHPKFDFDKCMDIAKKHGFDGYYSIEFEGWGDQVDGIKRTIELLKKHA